MSMKPASQPWGFVCYDLGIYHLADVAVDGVVGQCRGIRTLCLDLSVRNKSEFDQRRGEAVAMNIYGEQDMKIFESGVAYFK